MKKIAVYGLFLSFTFTSCKSERKESESEIITNSSLRFDTLKDGAGRITSIATYVNNQASNILFFKAGKPEIRYMTIEKKTFSNEFFFFNENGDTLKKGSVYHRAYHKTDTISKSEEYNFRVNLEGHVFDSAILYLFSVNETLTLNPDPVYAGVFPMKDREGPRLAVKGVTQGWNFISGRIDNCKFNSKRDSIVQVYFVDSFYVR